MERMDNYLNTEKKQAFDYLAGDNEAYWSERPPQRETEVVQQRTVPGAYTHDEHHSSSSSSSSSSPSENSLPQNDSLTFPEHPNHQPAVIDATPSGHPPGHHPTPPAPQPAWNPAAQPPSYTPGITTPTTSSLPQGVSVPGPGSYPNHISTAGPVGIEVVEQPGVSEKSLATAYILAFSLGFFGAHHFYLKRYGFGTLYFVTLGLFGMGYLSDLCRLPFIVKETNKKLKDPVRRGVNPDDCDEGYTWLLWFALGFLGAHHYYMRRWGWGALYTFTCGLCMVGWLIDPFFMRRRLRAANEAIQERRRENYEKGPSPKSLGVAYLLWLPPLGFIGAHQFYLNRPRWGMAYLFTGGITFVGWLADLVRMKWIVERENEQARKQHQMRREGKLHIPILYCTLDDAYVLHLSIFGLVGAAHFYTRRIGFGVLYLFTCGLFGIGWLVDFVLMKRHVDGCNQKLSPKTEIRLQYGPNTQVVVLNTSGYPGGVVQTGGPSLSYLSTTVNATGGVVSNSQAVPVFHHSGPVDPPPHSVPPPAQAEAALPECQPPSYDSVMNEQQEAQGPVNPAFTLDEGELDHGTQTKKRMAPDIPSGPR